MTQYWTKFKGGKFQLEYATKLVEDGKNVKFEVSKLSTLENRIYDIEATFFEDGNKITKHLELKNWNNFYPESIKSQFVKDLGAMEKLGDVQWVFNKTDNINDLTILKSKVMGALKNADGSAVEALDKAVKDNLAKFRATFGSQIRTSDDVIKALEKEDVFIKIFKIAE